LGCPDHPDAIDPGKPSRPGPPGPGRSSSGVLHLDPVGLARTPGGRVDGDGMIRKGWCAFVQLKSLDRPSSWPKADDSADDNDDDHRHPRAFGHHRPHWGVLAGQGECSA
jgi:hypothetical protein